MANRSADTHLHTFELPSSWGIDLYLKDESVHPTGSLKHRLARSFVPLRALQRLDPRGLDHHRGVLGFHRCFRGLLRPAARPAVRRGDAGLDLPGEDRADRVPGRALPPGGRRGLHLRRRSPARRRDRWPLPRPVHYAERATDWRGNNNIAESIFEQLSAERHPIPTWIVVGAGTGGTSATIGRYVRYRRYPTRVCVVDPENSAFFDGWANHDPSYATGISSRIEGIGRPRVEPSFLPSVVDAMISVPDAASIAAMRWTSKITGRSVGGSTGTAMWGALRLVGEIHASGQDGSVVTLLCDGGERYVHTYDDDAWVAAQGMDIGPYTATLERFYETGEWIEPSAEQ